MTDKIKELRGKLQERRDQLAKVFEEAGETFDMEQVKSLEGDTQAKVEKIRSLNDELSDLQDELKQAEEIVGIKRGVDELGEVKAMPLPNVGRQDSGETPPVKSLGEMFSESEAVKSWGNGRPGQAASISAPFVGVKATFTTGGSNLGPLAVQDQPGIQLVGTQRLTVANLLAQGTTTSESIRYVVESSFTNAATTVAEGAAKPEATWATDKVSDAVTKIAVVAKVTDELFADFAMLRDYIDNRMRFMVAQVEEAQLLAGGGTGSDLTGIMNRTGVQTQAKGADTTPDAFYKAMVKIMTGPFVQPDGIVIHPLDWQDIRLLRTADGIYIWGAPMDAGPERLWGLPVVVTTAITQNTGLVGAFKLGAQVWYRQGVQVDATNSNEDDFKKNLIALRAEERLALSVYLPSAFCKVTGI